ncbi:MAG: hypothetical protein OEV55_09210 [candidate division Zixibacteria bacterium]|nr:hypothetical protein [candidate division Zixibacteria bacterium]
MSDYKQIDLTKIKTSPFSRRISKTKVADFAKTVSEKSDIAEFIDTLPKYLKVNDLKLLLKAIHQARSKKKPVIFMFGAHIVKLGLSPIIIDLMRNKFITCLSTNGAGAIHDFEIGVWGKTSENVVEGLKRGNFGMSEETSRLFNRISKNAVESHKGLGESIGEYLIKNKTSFRKYSILASAYRLRIPVTAHVGIGTDIVHQSRYFDPASTGEATFTDFKILAQQISELNNGGVVLHFGSAVILPEVFLKALSVARNVKGKVENFTTANFDMIQHYRPNMNVVQRPVQGKGQGFSFTGHHEIMLPLLAWALKGSKT